MSGQQKEEQWEYVPFDFGLQQGYQVRRKDGTGYVMPAMVNEDGARDWRNYLNSLEVQLAEKDADWQIEHAAYLAAIEAAGRLSTRVAEKDATIAGLQQELRIQVALVDLGVQETTAYKRQVEQAEAALAAARKPRDANP